MNFDGLAYNKNDVRLRFYVASDGHYGQPKTEYEKYYDALVANVNNMHKTDPAKFAVINGDIIHERKDLLPVVKGVLDGMKMPYYVTKGNHDTVEDSYWEEIWKMPTNFSRAEGGNAFIFANTSNTKGEYLCPDMDFMKKALDEHKNAKNVFIFIHITQVKWTKYGIDSPQFVELLTHYPNIRGVFNGHDHEQDDIKVKNNVPYLFDGHFGSSWGVDYKGFRVVELMKDNRIFTYLVNQSNKIKSQYL